MLRTDGGDMRSGHMVPNIDEEARVVFAVGETDKRLQGAGGSSCACIPPQAAVGGGDWTRRTS